MLINTFHGDGSVRQLYVNANHISAVFEGSEEDSYCMYLTDDNDVYYITRESYERVIDWMERQDDAVMLRAAIAGDDGERHPMAEVMERLEGAC